MNILPRKVIGTAQPLDRTFNLGDLLILAGIAALLFGSLRLASSIPVIGPDINLAPSMLPAYTLLSTLRMAAAYFLSIIFSLLYGYFAARSKTAERVLMPVLDVLQSVPILSFLPVVLLGATAILPQGVAVEIAAVLLIFTSQAWNITYSFYQSLRTIPRDLREVSAVFRFNWWYRLRYMELPFSAVGLLWNSVMSWAGGWFFLMAAETFRVGERDFRLPGLGSYLQEAANQSDGGAIVGGLLALILIVVLLDQFIWRPLLAWVENFKLEMVENDNPPQSWFFDLTRRSNLATGFVSMVVNGLFRWLDKRFGRSAKARVEPTNRRAGLGKVIARLLLFAIVILIGFTVFEASQLLFQVRADEWGHIVVGTLSTALRVAVALIVALLWTIPLGVAIGTNPQLANFLQPIVQIAASIPATALFPVLVLVLINLPFGLNGAAILLMLLGTQWYLLFNVIAGASALPQDLKDIAQMFKLKGWLRWRTMILPALFPYIITGLITAGGGAWNASIVAEYTTFGGETYSVTGLGAIIASATDASNYGLLLAATLTMIGVVICINRFFWRRLYRLAEEKYRLDA